MQYIKPAMAGDQADNHDGIVMADAERSIKKPGELAIRAMPDPDREIPEIVRCD